MKSPFATHAPGKLCQCYSSLCISSCQQDISSHGIDYAGLTNWLSSTDKDSITCATSVLTIGWKKQQIYFQFSKMNSTRQRLISWYKIYHISAKVRSACLIYKGHFSWQLNWVKLIRAQLCNHTLFILTPLNAWNIMFGNIHVGVSYPYLKQITRGSKSVDFPDFCAVLV